MLAKLRCPSLAMQGNDLRIRVWQYSTEGQASRFDDKSSNHGRDEKNPLIRTCETKSLVV